MRGGWRALRRHGLGPGLLRAADVLAAGLSTRLRQRRERALIGASAFFDAEYYASRAPDVREAGVDPLRHFVASGWREGRNPHPMFDTAFYLRENPDVARLGLNPLVHFLTAGRGEGRRPSPGYGEGFALPLPPSAPERAAAPVARAVVEARKRPLPAGEREALLADVAAACAAQPRLVREGAAEATVLIPVFNQLRFTLWCLHALLAADHRRSFEVLVVDDASGDGTAAALAAVPALRVVRSDVNRGFIHACTLGAEHARGRRLVFLNNDTLPLAGWLDALHDTLDAHPQAGLVGAQLIYPDGRLQEAGAIVWQDGSAWNYGRDGDRGRPEFNYLRGVDFCSGAALAVDAELFRAAGGFDAALAPAYGEDLDLALRLRARGRPTLYQPRSQVVHLEGVTSGTSLTSGVKAHQVPNLKRLAERWRLELRAHRAPGQEPDLEKDRGAERRVLFADLFTPRPDQDAGSLDALQWMRALRALGYQVTFLPGADLRPAGRYTARLQAEGIECVAAPYAAAPEEFLAARGRTFDLCVFYRYQVAEALLPAVRQHAPQARRVLAVCDLAHLRLQRAAALSGSAAGAREALEVRLSELRACIQCDGVVTPSRAEAELLRRELPHLPVFSWPLAQELRPPRRPFAQRHGIGFLGGFRHAPNVDAVLHFVADVLPLVLREDPGQRFLVAGSQAPPEIAGIDHPAVTILGQVDDLDALFEEVRVLAVPLRFGAGMKGKVAAAMAAGLPVVGTTVALEGMELEDGEGALAADGPRDQARALLRVHDSEELWSALSRRGLERARRDYSAEAGTRALARALTALGAGTRAAEELLADEEPPDGRTAGGWPGIAGLEVAVCRSAEEHRALRKGAAEARRRGIEARLLEEADGGGLRLRGYSVPAARSVVFTAGVATDAAGRRTANWREDLVCPVTQLNNRQRALAAFAQQLIVTPAEKVEHVYLTEQVTPLFRWITRRFPTVPITGSEYLGPGLAGGTTRDGLRHEDVERLSFAPASLDLVLSCDVLEHVDDPRRALGELARVLRPGGHLLFTVPFHFDNAENLRRARGVGDAVEHLAEPCYHGNPMDPNGSLAYFDFGWELLRWVAEAGFREVSVLCYWSEGLGHLGGGLEAFHARR